MAKYVSINEALALVKDNDYIVSNEPLPKSVPLGKAQAIIPE